MTPEAERQAELLAELEVLEAQGRARRARLARMLRWGSLVIAASFLFMLRGDLRYALQPSQPVELGGPMEFDLSHQQSQVYARVVGIPGAQAATVTHMGQPLRIFGLLSTNLLIEQDLSKVGPDEQPARGRPFEARGRLLREDDAGELRRVFELMEANGTISRQNGHLFALVEGEVPRGGWTLPVELFAIALFVLLNFLAAARIVRPFSELDESLTTGPMDDA